MVSYLIYVLILVISIIISLILLKLVVMKIADFYEHINIAILILLIFVISIFLFPKHIDAYFQKTTPNKSCGCFGIKISSLNNFEIDKNCYGIKFSCDTFESFKEKTLNNYLLCDRKSDFYISPDECYYDIAKLMAGKASNENGSFDQAFSTCNKIANNLKGSCIKYVATLKSGGVIFSPPKTI